MKIWKDKSGKWITPKEFATRFGEGVQQVSPIQQSKVTLLGQSIILMGILIGLFVTFNQTWWLFIILIGSFIVSGTATLGAWQKFKIMKQMFSQIDTQIPEVKNNQLNILKDKND